MPDTGALTCLAALKGHDLIGTPLRAPRCPHDCIYVLPLLTILMTKGTGVVTSVPSDSPTDYIALQDLKKKPKLREKYGVQDDWVLPFEVVPIIDIPGFGNQSAVKVRCALRVVLWQFQGAAVMRWPLRKRALPRCVPHQREARCSRQLSARTLPTRQSPLRGASFHVVLSAHCPCAAAPPPSAVHTRMTSTRTQAASPW